MSRDKTDATRKARIAVIGTGWWATYAHLPALVKRSDVDVVALANRGHEKLEKAADAFGVGKTYTDYAEMLESEDLDGVVVATSHASHYDAGKAALQHGCHVLIEKPMALCSAHAHELLGIARDNDLHIVMSCPWQFTGHAIKAAEILQSGELGEIQHVSSMFTSWAYETYRGDHDKLTEIFEGDLFENSVIKPRDDANTNPQQGGGQGWCQMSHAAALLFGVTGLRPKRVSAYMSALDVAVDVVDAVSLRLNNGAPAVMSSTGNVRPVGDPGQHVLWIHCSRGYLGLDVIEGTLTIRKDGMAVAPIARLPEEKRYPRFAPADNFVDVVLKGERNLCPGAIGCVVVDFLEACYRSAGNDGEPMVVRMDQEEPDR